MTFTDDSEDWIDEPSPAETLSTRLEFPNRSIKTQKTYTEKVKFVSEKVLKRGSNVLKVNSKTINKISAALQNVNINNNVKKSGKNEKVINVNKVKNAPMKTANSANVKVNNAPVKDNNANIKVNNVQSVQVGNASANLGNNQYQEQSLEHAYKFFEKNIQNNLVKNKNILEVQRKDSRLPMDSIETFKGMNLPKKLSTRIYEVGFKNPSTIQKALLPALLIDPPQNVIVQAQPGSGETTAFALAMISKVDTKKSYTQVICLAPTYLLVVQIGELITFCAKYCPDLKLKYAVEDERVNPGTKLDEHIVIGTPSQVTELIAKSKGFSYGNIKVCVVNKLDIMKTIPRQQGFVIPIILKLPPQCQIMFSSTMYDKKEMKFIETYVSETVIIRQKTAFSGKIIQYYSPCKSEEEKCSVIVKLLISRKEGQSVIFCSSTKQASCLSKVMKTRGHTASLLTQETSFEDELRMLSKFRDGIDKILVTTKVLVGIHIEQITTVINVDLPIDNILSQKVDCGMYLHRASMIGGYKNAGIVLNLFNSSSGDFLKQIEDCFGRKVHVLKI